MTHREALLQEVKGCRHCAEHLPLGPHPIVILPPTARIAIVSQAPGRIAHESGTAFQDASGLRLRQWLGVDEHIFYQEGSLAVLPIGFCYPGRGKSGDLPPRPECAPLWHNRLWPLLPQIRLKLLVGAHAQKYYLGKNRRRTLTDTVRHYRAYLPEFFPIPHPSPINTGWLRRNAWFEAEVVPELQSMVRKLK